MTTTARVLQTNVRLYSLSRADGHPWDALNKPKPPVNDLPYRKETFAKMLAATTPSIVAVQECDQKYALPDILAQLAKQDKQPWRYHMRGKVGVLYNAAKWKATALNQFDVDNAAEADRRVVITRLESIKTGEPLLTASVHYGVHFEGSERERMEQAATTIGGLKALGGDDLPTAVFGDLNDQHDELATGVRRVFAQENIRSVREKAPAAELKGVKLNSHHGYKPTKADGTWISDALTGPHVTVLSAELIVTDPASDFPCATDHNALFARLRYGSPSAA